MTVLAGRFRLGQNLPSFSVTQVDEFQIDAIRLGDLKMIRIGHDTSGTGDAWFLDKVIIKDPEENEKQFTFLCNRYLRQRIQFLYNSVIQSGNHSHGRGNDFQSGGAWPLSSGISTEFGGAWPLSSGISSEFGGAWSPRSGISTEFGGAWSPRSGISTEFGGAWSPRSEISSESCLCGLAPASLSQLLEYKQWIMVFYGTFWEKVWRVKHPMSLKKVGGRQCLSDFLGLDTPACAKPSGRLAVNQFCSRKINHLSMIIWARLILSDGWQLMKTMGKL